jgi:hypothetical protein
LDTIRLSPKSLSTKVVQVTADKENVMSIDDKIIMNVNKSMGNNAAEVLENTPMVNIDINGNVSLLGRPGVVIYIDGIPAKYSGFENADDLKLLSSTEVEKIEIVLDPSLEYSEKGDGGIINIITKKKQSNKYSGNIGLGGDTKNRFISIVGISYNYKDIFARGIYSNRYSKFNSSSSQIKTIQFDNAMGYMEKTVNSENKAANDYITLNLGYNPDNSSTLSTMFSFSRRNSDNKRFLINQMSGDGSSSLDNFSSNNLSNTIQKFSTWSLSYRRQFAEKGHNFSAMFIYIDNSLNLNNNADKRVFPVSDQFLKQFNNSLNSNNSLRLRLSYDQPFSNNFKLESGYYCSSKILKMDNTYNNFDQLEQKFVENPAQKIRSKFGDLTNYIYVQLRGKFWDINYNFGSTLEYYQLKNEDFLTGFTYKHNYTNFIPGFSISKLLMPGHNLSLSYSRKSNYPENRQLNPHIDNTDSTDLKMGNPDLEPYYGNSLAVDYRITTKDLFLRGGLFYSPIKDIIEQVTTQNSLRTATTTYKNLTSSNNLQAYIYGSKTFAGWFKLEPQASVYRLEYGGSNANNSGLAWNASVRSGISFNSLKFQVDFRYSSPEIAAQSKSDPRYCANAAVKVLFLDKQLSLTLKSEDIFNTLSQKRNISGIGFYGINSLKETTRMLSLDIAYFFQSKTDDSIDENNDTEEYNDF